MKIILAMTVLLLSTSLFAAEQELALQVKPDGKPAFGMQYAYDFDMFWGFTFTSAMTNETLATLPESIYWNLLDTTTDLPIAAWSEIQKNNLMTGTIGLNTKPAVAKLLPRLNSAKIAFAIKDIDGNIDVLYSIPLQPLCQNHASHILDMTDLSKGACKVTAKDLPK